MKKKYVISLFVLLLFVLLGIWFIKGHTKEIITLLKIRIDYVVILFLSASVMVILRGHMIKMQMESYGIGLKFKEWLGLELAMEFWNTITPFKGGVPARAVYLKKKYGFSYVSSVSLNLVNYAINFLFYGLGGIAVSFFIPISEDIRWGFFVVFVFITLSSLFVIFLRPFDYNGKIRILRYLVKSLESSSKVRDNYVLIGHLFLNSFLRFCLGTFRVYIAFLAFGYPVSFLNCWTINIFIGITQFISVTPMNLGFREAVIVLSSKLLGVGSVVGALVAALDRIVGLLIIFAAAPFFGYLLSRDFKRYGP